MRKRSQRNTSPKHHGNCACRRATFLDIALRRLWFRNANAQASRLAGQVFIPEQVARARWRWTLPVRNEGASEIFIERDFYRVAARRVDVRRAHAPPILSDRIVLAIAPGLEFRRDIRGRPQIIAFPQGIGVLAELATLTDTSDEGEGIEILLPRSAFDLAADHFGFGRITSLEMKPGAGADDVVLFHLAASFSHALNQETDTGTSTITDLALALMLRISRKFGNMTAEREKSGGGLASWQLRLARETLDRHLDGEISLSQLAAECGLSMSHFTRAFSKSTGRAPHRWLTHRRVEVAKDLIIRSDLPLAQIALTCGFSDQSHFTRVFASLVGLTPARWLSKQQEEWAAAVG